MNLPRLALALALSLTPSLAQSPSPSLTPDQQKLFKDAQADFQTQKFADALQKFQTLHVQLPDDPLYPKYAAEAAVNTEDFAAAKQLLQPILASDPDDPQALGIMAHTYAQEHNSAQRDAVLAHMQQLYTTGKLPMKSMIVEKSKLPSGGSMNIFYYFEPWSMYKITLMARFFDPQGKQTYRVTLESLDIDQMGYAKEHPKEAAAGGRRYSFDGYADSVTADGKPTQTQALYGFVDANPSYDEFRERALSIGAGHASASATTTVSRPTK